MSGIETDWYSEWSDTSKELDAALARVARLEAALKDAADLIDEYYFYNPTCHCGACTEARGISERARAALEREP